MAAIREAQGRRVEEQARVARERARQAAESFNAASSDQTQQRRPTPGELGYYTTDDSFTNITYRPSVPDQLGERLRKSDAKRQFSRRLSDLFGRDG